MYPIDPSRLFSVPARSRPCHRPPSGRRRSRVAVVAALLWSLAACGPAPAPVADSVAAPAPAAANPAPAAADLAWDRYASPPSQRRGAALYWSLQGTPPDYAALVGLFDRGARSADAFAQQAREQAFAAAFAADLAAASGDRAFRYEVGADLGHYDFGQKAFPLSVGNLGRQFIHWFCAPGECRDRDARCPPGMCRDRGYAVAFEGLDVLAAVPVADPALARRIEADVTAGRARLRLSAKAIGTEAADGWGDVHGTVVARLMRVAILDAEGREVAAAERPR